MQGQSKKMLYMLAAAFCLAAIYLLQKGLVSPDKGQAMAIPAFLTITLGAPLVLFVAASVFYLWKLNDRLFDLVALLLHVVSLADIIYLYNSYGSGFLLRSEPIPEDWFLPYDINFAVAGGASALILLSVLMRRLWLGRKADSTLPS